MDDEIPVHGDSHASSSHEASLEPTTKRREDLVSTVLKLISLKTEIARSVNGPKIVKGMYLAPHNHEHLATAC